MNKEPEHARLAPSSGHRWGPGRCPASVNRQEGLPDVSTEASIEGDAAHLVLNGLLTDDPDGPDPVAFLAAVKLIGPEGEAHVRAALDYVRDGDMVYLSEHKVNPGTMLDRDDCWGTLDIQRYLDPEEEVEIADYKHGFVIVEPEENYQLILYALGVLAAWPPFFGRPKRFKLTIIQPRAPHPDGPIRSWVVDTQDLLNVWAPRFKAAARATDADMNPATVPGGHCRDCKVHATCREARDHAASVVLGSPYTGDETPVEVLTEGLLQDQGTLSAGEIGIILENAALVRAWLKAVEKAGMERYLAGTPIPGTKVVEGRGSRAWGEQEGEDRADTFARVTKALRSLTCVDKKKVPKSCVLTESLVSPAQAEKRIKPKVSKRTWEKVQSLIHKKPGAKVLVPDTDKRPAVAMAAREIFSPIDVQTLAPSDVHRYMHITNRGGGAPHE